MRGPRDPKSPEILAVCAAARCRLGTGIQNLSESIKLAVFGHVRSYILIIRRDSRAILYIPRDLSLFGCRRGCSEERVGPDGEIKSFRIYKFIVSVHGDVCAPPARRADSLREMSEAERPGWMRKPHEHRAA